MIEFLFSATIMLFALIMAVALRRAENRDRDNFSRAINLAFYGTALIAWAKAADMVFIAASAGVGISAQVAYYADLAVQGVVILGIGFCTRSLLFWLTGGKHLASTADAAVKLRDRVQVGYENRGLALSTVPAILYRETAAIDDDTPNFKFLNDKIEEILGYSREELESNPQMLFQLMCPDDRRRYLSGERHFMMTHPQTVLEHRFKHKNGEYRWLRRHIMSVDGEHGNLRELVGCAFDVTDLKEAEARLQFFLDSAPDAVVTVDKQGLIVLANTRATLTFGRPKEGLLGKHYRALISESDRQLLGDHLANLPDFDADQGASSTIELSGLRHDGATFPAELNFSSIRRYDSELMALAIRDISVRKETEAKLWQAQKMEAVGHLSGGLVHDFNNMLSVIIGNLELIDQAELGENTRQCIDEAMSGADRASDLTRRLLTFSAQQSLSPKVTKINDLVAEVESLLRRALGEGISLTTGLAENLWPVRVDAGQLENSLMNLAINARDALEPDGQLTIETSNAVLNEGYAARHADVTPGDYVQIAIRDNGTGIAKGVLPHIFDPFFTTKAIGKGSGLGLSMVYGFVKQSRGHISVESEEGHGTTINIYLRRYSSELADGSEQRAITESAPTGEERILVVEDNGLVRETVGDLLKSLNYDVLQADSGSSALEILNEESNVDLLFTDLVMPGGMTGVELATKVRQQNPAMRVLYTSGYRDAALSNNDRLRPDDAVLAKPYQKEVLAKSVRDVLDTK